MALRGAPGLAVAGRPLRAPDAGPTIRLHYGRTDGPGNAIADFMYFVPLISPERVTVVTSKGNTQRARVHAVL